jgi:hypothetical protein
VVEVEVPVVGAGGVGVVGFASSDFPELELEEEEPEEGALESSELLPELPLPDEELVDCARPRVALAMRSPERPKMRMEFFMMGVGNGGLIEAPTPLHLPCRSIEIP